MKYLTLASMLVSCTLMAVTGANIPLFDDFDTDGNGVLTQTEFKNAQQTRMQKQAEAGKQMRNAGNAPAFKDIDANNDGSVTPAEFRNHQSTQMQNSMNSNNNVNMGKCSGMGQGAGMGQGKK